MNLVENVYEMSRSFMKNSSYVVLNEEGIERIASKMKEQGNRPFPSVDIDNQFKHVLMHLVGGAINYCYWYGRSDFRPLDCRASKMFTQVEKAFQFYDINPFGESLQACAENLVSLLSIERFPLLEQREKHIFELVKNGEKFVNSILIDGEKTTCIHHLENLVSLFPGYASDQFLKRASLFFLMLYRYFGWFEVSTLTELHVPADYQVPKVLEHEGCIKYHPPLKEMIENNSLIPKYSQIECEIRSATVLACDKLKKLTGWNMSDVDGWFWLGSKKVDGPFHLTITTDY